MRKIKLLMIITAIILSEAINVFARREDEYWRLYEMNRRFLEQWRCLQMCESQGNYYKNLCQSIRDYLKRSDCELEANNFKHHCKMRCHGW